MYSIPDDLVITSLDKFYFTCPSYGFISAVLSIIDEIISHNPEINIIVMDEQLRSFWDQLIEYKGQNWNLIYLSTTQQGRYRDVLSWFKIRPFINKLFEDNFKSLEKTYFYCCGFAGDLVIHSLMRLIATKNTVVYLNIYYEKTRTVYSLKALILLLHSWLIFRIDVAIRGSFNGKPVPTIFLSERFFEKNSIEHHEFEYHYNSRLFKKYNTIPSHYALNKRIMWLGDDCLSYDNRVEGKIINCFKAIKSIIDENFVNDEVLFKPHPNPFFNAKASTSISHDYEGLPSFMNSDFILANSNIQFVLGGVSAVMATAAKNTKIVAISYLNLMPFEDEKIRHSMVESWAKFGDQKILFIKSLEELSLLLKESPA